MRVLHVHDRWSALGGADWHLIGLLKYLPREFKAYGLFGRMDGSVGADKPVSLPGGPHFIKKLDKKAPFAAEKKVAVQVRKTVSRLKPDLIHVHNILNPVLLETLAEPRPAVITVQDHRFFCPGRGKVRADGSLCHRPYGLSCAECFQDEKYFVRLLTLVRARLAALSGFTSIIVLSNYMKSELVTAGLEADKIHVIPPFVHGFEGPANKPVPGWDILFAGRLVWAKGIFDLFEALALTDPGLKLLVAGDGPAFESVAVRGKDLGLVQRIGFTGWTDHPDMACWYQSVRVVVMPSRWQEPFGIVGIEAQSQARPVVAYDSGGIRDWFEDGVTGLLVPSGNVPALAESLDTICHDADTAAAMGQAGQRLVNERFNRDVLMNRLVDLYRQVIR